MEYILFFIAGIALGMFIFSYAKNKKKPIKIFAPREPEELKEMRKKAHKTLTKRTEGRKEEIIEMLKDENILREKFSQCSIPDEDSLRMLDGKITSLDVEKLIGVSGGTARKYLNELEDEDKIKQIGKSGRDVHYILNPQNHPSYAKASEGK